MLQVILSSFFLIFIAEMGDKTQLMAMAFTTRFKPLQVFSAISTAIILNNLIAVIAGSLIAGIFPISIIKIVSFILFILFGLWTIYDGNSQEEKKTEKTIINPFFTIAIFFFLSEFGDKTQIAAMTLAMNQNPLYVFIGACAGMIAANLIGIFIGVFVSKNLPSHIIKWISAIIFIAIGLIGFGTVFFAKFNITGFLLAETALILIILFVIFFIIKKKE